MPETACFLNANKIISAAISRATAAALGGVICPAMIHTNQRAVSAKATPKIRRNSTIHAPGFGKRVTVPGNKATRK